MKKFSVLLIGMGCFFFFSLGSAFAADAKALTVTCVGLYSETSDGYISTRAGGKGDWVPVKVGDVIPANGEIKINVERDWIEVRPTADVNSVFEIAGSGSGDLIVKVSDILKGKPRTVSFPAGSAAKSDPKYKDKLVVREYLGRQIFINASGDSRDIKYGDVLEVKGKIKIIAINNTLTLINASGAATTVFGPLSFTVEQVLTNKSLYKFLNVQK